jgi:hypothetical protein
MIHRIVYQSNEAVVVACGLWWVISREEVRAADWLTLQRGKQTCPECLDYLDAFPPAAISLLSRRDPDDRPQPLP